MGHSSSEDSDREHYRHLKHEEKMERKRRKRMLKHARRNPGLLLPIDYHEYPQSSHHGLIPPNHHHHHHHHHHGGPRGRHERPGLISLIGGVVSALAGGHQRSRSAPPLSDLNYNNNQPGLPRQYPAPGYPPPDHDNQSYGLGDKPTKSTGPTQEYAAPPGPPPPAYSADPLSVPPSGFRFPLNTTPAFFPKISNLGTPPCFDLDGSPLYFGSAFLPRSVHPCKVSTHLEPHALLAYGGREQAHFGRYDLLPFSPQTMELVRTSHGQIPPGRRPVEGGYEENGDKLYHAVATVRGVKVPGKAGVHLGGANVGFGGEEFVISDNYEVLCWK